MAFRVTYATLAAESDEVHAAFDAGLAELQPHLGARQGSIISGRERTEGPEVVERSPVDGDILIGRFVTASEADVAEAVGAAKAAGPSVGRHALAGAGAAPGGRARTSSPSGATSSPRS